MAVSIIATLATPAGSFALGLEALGVNIGVWGFGESVGEQNEEAAYALFDLMGDIAGMNLTRGINKGFLAVAEKNQKGYVKRIKQLERNLLIFV